MLRRENVEKPLMVDRYNTFMGGVNKSDQLLSYYGLNHRQSNGTNEQPST